MSVTIKPTVGRVMWFFGEIQRDDLMRSVSHPGRQPLAAIVTHVWSDDVVNLTVFTMEGHSIGQQTVRLVQDGTPHSETRWCEWMPYQKGQAAKTEAAEAALASGRKT